MRRWLKRIFFVLAVFVPILAAFYFYAQWQGDRELRGVIAELDAQGEPWRWDDLLAARPKGPEDEKVRALINQVVFVARRGWKSKNIQRSIPPNAFFSPEVGAVLAKDFKALEQTIAEARTTLNMPSGRYVVQHGAKVLQPPGDNVLDVLHVSELLQLAAMWHARQGDLDLAIEDCQATQHASRILQDEPELLGQLVRVAMQTIAIETLEHVLAQGIAPSQELRQLQEALEQSGIERAMIEGVRGERAGQHRIYTAMADGEITLHDLAGKVGGPSSIRESALELYGRWNLKHAHTWALRQTTAILNAMELPEPQRSAELRNIQNDESKAPRHAMTSHICAHVIEAQRVTARTRCAILGLALECYRQANERWPQSLDDLCPKYVAVVLEDPCSGEPLRYRFTKDGVVVYSVGLDGNLRGAYRDDAKLNQRNAAYEFRLWNVPQRRQMAVAKP